MSVIGGELCRPDGVSLTDRATSAEYTLATDSWATVPSNYVELAQTTEMPQPWSRRSAWTPDGSAVVAVAPGRRVLSREGTGLWTDTGHRADVVVATDSAVFGVSVSVDAPVAEPVTQIWPASG